MRKTIFVLVSLCLVISAFSACSSGGAFLQNEGPASEEAASLPSENQTLTENDDDSGETIPEPPSMLFFGSVQDYSDFTDSVNMETEAFDSYIKRNNYYMNGVHTKQDVLEVVDFMKALPLPASEAFDFVQMEFYVDEHTCFVLYQGDDSERCSFLIYIDEEDQYEPPAQGEEVRMIPVEVLEGIESLYVLNDEESSSVKAYMACIQGYSVLVRTYDIASIVPVLSSFVFDYDAFCGRLR